MLTYYCACVTLDVYFLDILFFSASATPEFYTLSLHDALPISLPGSRCRPPRAARRSPARSRRSRSEEHTSELQSLRQLVCRLLLEKKKSNYNQLYRLNRHCSNYRQKHYQYHQQHTPD